MCNQTSVIMLKMFLFIGRPDVAAINSSKQGRSKNSYDLLWTVKSYSPIIEYKVLYRPDKTNKSNQEIQYKRPMRRVSITIQYRLNRFRQ